MAETVTASSGGGAAGVGVVEGLLLRLGGVAGLAMVGASGVGTVLGLFEIVSGGASVKEWWAFLLSAAVLMGAVFAALLVVGIGKMHGAMTMFVAGGTGAVAAVLTEFDLVFVLLGRPAPGQWSAVGGVELRYIAGAELASGLLLLVLSGLALVVRVPKGSLPRLAVGGALLGVSAFGAKWVISGGASSVMPGGGGAGGAALVAGGAALGLVIGVLVVSVGVHLVAGALTLGMDQRAELEDGGAGA